MSANAKERAEALAKIVGNIFSKTPIDVLERRMDRPKQSSKRMTGDASQSSKWMTRDGRGLRRRRSIYKERERITALVERQSFCWPICMKYAIVTVGLLGLTVEQGRATGLRLGEDQGEDTFVLDEHGQALPMQQFHIVAFLGMKKQNVSATIAGMVARKAITIESTKHGDRICPAPHPAELTEEERRSVIQIDDSFDLPPGPALVRQDLELLASIQDRVIRLDVWEKLTAFQTEYLQKQ